MKKNLFLMAVAAVAAIIVTMTSCRQANEVTVTLPSGTEMEVRVGYVKEKHIDGPFMSKEGVRRLFLMYSIEYTVKEEDMASICGVMEGNTFSSWTADKAYYWTDVQFTLISIEKKARTKTYKELKSEEFKKEVQKELDLINPVFLSNFKITFLGVQ
jgi:hypothetical protein